MERDPNLRLVKGEGRPGGRPIQPNDRSLGRQEAGRPAGGRYRRALPPAFGFAATLAFDLAVAFVFAFVFVFVFVFAFVFAVAFPDP